MKTFNFFIIILSLLALNLVEFVLCQIPTETPKAPVNLIPTTIGTITTQPATAIPDTLAVPKGHNFAFLLYASGNQQYKCITNQWLNSGADAMLINDVNDIQQHFDPAFEVAHHYISSTPIYGGNYTWDSLLPTDNSQVVTKFVDSVNSTQSNAIPWEITAATFRKEGGRFSNTSYVLRVNTNGGISPPQDQCGVQFIDGSTTQVQYTAEYWFYEGPLPGTEQPAQPAAPSSPSKSNGHSTNSIGSSQLGWVAIVGFISVGVIIF
ncbi:hypothetical protein C1645_786881 [Glomus cerebriforme]|uniref:Uncharacterized protein n=1 Tax=Glomus cerebriforme TaxID=658196 RepID=A0A397SK71_9GLOM|nr:hypothetical protein C1645_786881 [Glomus cerebriforme]